MITRETAYKMALEQKREALKEKKREYNMLLAAAYASNPRLKEIDREHNAVGAQLVNAALSGEKALDDLKKCSSALTHEKNLLLKQYGVKAIDYDCTLCGDTGYINGKLCDCVKKISSGIIISELSGEMPLESSRFESFNLNYYSDIDGTEGNPRRRMTAILKVCTEYAMNFDPKKSHNLLFMGSAGLGKTHLTLAIVSSLVQKGFFPIYGSAENLFAQLEKERFTDQNRLAYGAMTSCDLLVIDDLGAETSSTFTKSVLYNLINTRLLSGIPTIINTNLSMKEIEMYYTARISSRLIGNYDAYKFIGDDIRQQKAIERMNKE